MNKLPENYLLEYIMRKSKKDFPTWEDVNELKIAAKQMIGIMCESSNEAKAFELFDGNLKRIKYDIFPIGVMVSFIHPDHPTIMVSGYSLCNLAAGDEFDYLCEDRRAFLYKEAKGLGKTIAMDRAIKWVESNSIKGKEYLVPSSIKKQFKDFVLRSQRYYKDKVLPIWLAKFLELS